jgi:serine/threonine protein kinase
MIHERGLVHRDVKPDNFLLGLGKKNNQIYIIDFGFCKSFLNNNKHIENKKTSNLIGTPNFASINAHEFNELSRRDDLESLGYMLIYFYYGNLIWKDLTNNEMIKIMKNNIINNDDIEPVLINYLKIIKYLEFSEIPNYDLLIDMFKNKIKLL